MTGAPLSPIPGLPISMALAGFLFGLLYFVALQRTAIFLATRRGWLVPIALTLARIGTAAGFLVLAARMGASPLLAAFIGFLLARAVALRVAGRIS
ncbi:MAG: ATP synthase subunit I [Rhodomicrobium sp.]